MQQNRKSGAPEIEITPEMIEAGVQVLWQSGAVENPIVALDRDLVGEIFLAMLQRRPSAASFCP